MLKLNDLTMSLTDWYTVPAYSDTLNSSHKRSTHGQLTNSHHGQLTRTPPRDTVWAGKVTFAKVRVVVSCCLHIFVEIERVARRGLGWEYL